MKIIFTAAAALASAAGCSPVITGQPGTETCQVWAAPDSTVNVDPPCELNLIDISSFDCDHAGGRFEGPQDRPGANGVCYDVDY